MHFKNWIEENQGPIYIKIDRSKPRENNIHIHFFIKGTRNSKMHWLKSGQLFYAHTWARRSIPNDSLFFKSIFNPFCDLKYLQKEDSFILWVLRMHI